MMPSRTTYDACDRRPRPWGRSKDLPLANGVLLRGAHAPRANMQLPGIAVDDDGRFLDVRQPAPIGLVMRMTNVVAKGCALATDVTPATHGQITRARMKEAAGQALA